MKYILETFVRFASSVLEGNDVSVARESLGELMKEMRDYNDNPANTEALPWAFLDPKTDESVDVEIISQIIAEAEARGLQDHFKIIDMAGCQVLFFSHGGRFLAESLCNRLGVGYSNILGCGLVHRDLVLMAPYLATEQRLRKELELVRMMLGKGSKSA